MLLVYISRLNFFLTVRVLAVSSKFTQLVFVTEDPEVLCYGEIRIRCTTNYSVEPYIIFYTQYPMSRQLKSYPEYYEPDLYAVSDYQSHGQFLSLELIIHDYEPNRINGTLFSCRHYNQPNYSSKLRLLIPGL